MGALWPRSQLLLGFALLGTLVTLLGAELALRRLVIIRLGVVAVVPGLGVLLLVGVDPRHRPWMLRVAHVSQGSDGDVSANLRIGHWPQMQQGSVSHWLCGLGGVARCHGARTQGPGVAPSSIWRRGFGLGFYMVWFARCCRRGSARRVPFGGQTQFADCCALARSAAFLLWCVESHGSGAALVLPRIAC